MRGLIVDGRLLSMLPPTASRCHIRPSAPPRRQPCTRVPVALPSASLSHRTPPRRRAQIAASLATATASLMLSSVFLATAAAMRTACIRPPIGGCSFRAASFSSRPRRSRPPLACEVSSAQPTASVPGTRPSPSPPPAELPARPNGIVVAYKPQNWTSFDVVAKARGCLENDLRKSGHEFKRRSRLKVGHGGTLDPMAEGLLVLGIGTGCRGLEGYLKGGKAYRATARLGFETDTQDATGEVLSTAATAHVTISDLRAAAAGLVGTILQRPPIYSALRKDGKRLHELARAGKLQEEDVEPRQVTVHSLDVTDFDATSSTFGLRVRCGGGTYVRTLIVDLGRAVGSAAHMTALVRTQVGPFACEGTGADGVSVMRPVREGQFGEAACYYAAMDEAAAVLEAEAQRGAGADEGGAAWCPPTDEKSEEWNGRW